MSLLELGGKQFSIPVGEVALGSDASCAIPLSGAGVLPRHAVVAGQPDGQVVIRKATPVAEVLVNGVRLGAEPTPLLHGDKLELGGYELTFVDERRAGTTRFVEKVQMPEPVSPTPAKAATRRVIRSTGGRVVSLTDGREYVMSGASLVFGREAGCDVVVPETDVSRRHAEIVQTPQGYLLVDSSTNGSFVNEERVQGQRILQRADVIRIGDQSFRFYADVVPGAGAVGPESLSPPASAQAAALPPLGAAERLQLTMHGLEAAQPPPSRGGAFASFLVRAGELKGWRVPVKTPVVNIGRADYNDLVFPDPSVSTAHAKLQQREGVWVLVDLDSTNGTFVDGERVKGEAPLAPGATVRLGDVQLVFEPADDAVAAAMGGGGGTHVLSTFQEPRPPAPTRPEVPTGKPRAPAAPAAPARRAPKVPPRGAPGARRPGFQPLPEKKTTGCGASAALFILVGAGLVVIVQRLLA